MTGEIVQNRGKMDWNNNLISYSYTDKQGNELCDNISMSLAFSFIELSQNSIGGKFKDGDGFMYTVYEKVSDEEFTQTTYIAGVAVDSIITHRFKRIEDIINSIEYEPTYSKLA